MQNNWTERFAAEQKARIDEAAQKAEFDKLHPITQEVARGMRDALTPPPPDMTKASEEAAKRQTARLREKAEDLFLEEMARDILASTSRPKMSNRNPAAFLLALQEHPDEREKALRPFFDDGVVHKAALNTTSGPQAGYLLPTWMLDSILMTEEPALFRPAALQVQVPALEGFVPVPDMTTIQPAGTTPLYGGITLSCFLPGTSAPESEPTFKLVSVVANYLGGSLNISNVLQSDQGPGTAQALLRLIGKAVNWYEDYFFLRGTGQGQPVGVLNANCTISVTRNTASHIVFADVAGMLAKLFPGSINRCFWAFSPSALTDLMQLKDGANRAALVQVGGSSNNPTWSLCGRPAYPTEKLPALGSKGDLMLIDPSMYAVTDHMTHAQQMAGVKRSLAITFSAHGTPAFKQNQSTYLIGQLFDGQPWLDKPITLQDGATQVSPFVALN